jgi:protein-S-isoprenylcysteine O-methyltransferase Ste14
MLNSFLSNPLFWIGIYLAGYTITIVVLSLRTILTAVENKIPKSLIRVFLLLTFIVPPVALPFTRGPKITISTPITLIVGIILLALNFYVKAISQRQIGVIPALKRKEKLVTTGIYGILRHPAYLSNGLLAVGMAIFFRSIYALLFSIPYFLFFLPIIYFEERDLLQKYGKEYQEYKKKVPWRMIPIFMAFAAGAMIFVSIHGLYPMAQKYKKLSHFAFGIFLSLIVYFGLSLIF